MPNEVPADRPIRSRGRAWARRLYALAAVVLVGGVLFQWACIARPRHYDTPLTPSGGPPLPESAAEWAIRVAHYNVWGIPIVSENLAERIAKTPPAIAGHEPDVICLQEVWSCSIRADLADGFGDRYAVARSDGGGLMLLSRHPILEERFTPFPFSFDLPISEWPAKKGVLEVVLDTPVGRVRVVNTHLALDFGENNARTPQLEFLLKLLDDRRDLPLILCADLNTAAVRNGVLQEEYAGILERGFVSVHPPKRTGDSWDPGPPTRVRWPRVPGTQGHHPDHVMVRGTPGIRIVPTSFRMDLDTPETALSDHNLLIANLVLVRLRPSEDR